MRSPNRPRSHTPNPLRADRIRNRWSARLRPELVSDGVVAGYLHDISGRHASSAAEPRIRRERGDRA